MTDFDQMPKRQGTNSIKWQVKDGELPMWIADMDFAVSPAIIAAIKQKLELKAFGYEEIPDEYYQAVAAWYEKIHGYRPDPSWMIFVTGVVPAITSAVKRLTHVGDKVLVQAPVYNMFYHSIENTGRHVLSSDLQYDQATTRYHVDWEDLEEKLADPLTNMMIFCNPHNPTGHVWSRDEVMRIASLCAKHQVVLFSDEIHGDLTFDQAYTPVFSLPDELKQHAVIAVSPSKTFNVAALHAATVIVPNSNLRAQVSRGLNSDELAEPNLAAIPGTIAAYTQSNQWYHDLLDYLAINRQLVQTELADTPIKVSKEAGTYLLWLDISQFSHDSAAFSKFLREKTGLILSAGDVYGANGHDFVRMNVAAPRKLVADGLTRLKRGVQLWQKQG